MIWDTSSETWDGLSLTHWVCPICTSRIDLVDNQFLELKLGKCKKYLDTNNWMGFRHFCKKKLHTLDAYELYLLGKKYCLAQEFEKVEKMSKILIELDPTCILYHALLNDAYKGLLFKKKLSYQVKLVNFLEK
jgi:hypothetical protein